LCDILLVLLIIFMVITPMTQNGMDIIVPESGGQGNGKPIILSVEADGSFFINTEKYDDRSTFGTRLKEIYLIRGDKTAFVQAHDKVPYQEVINAMDTAKMAGVDTLSLIPYKTR